jgi:signal transduction histidine kinase
VGPSAQSAGATRNVFSIRTSIVTALSIAGLCIFIFGAYAYGAVVVLSLRHHAPVWPGTPPEGRRRLRGEWIGLAMFVTCTVWFLLQSAVEFRYLMGEPRGNDLLDLAALEICFVFPGLILHTVLFETGQAADAPRRPAMRWLAVMFALYAAGLVLAIYTPLAVYDLVPSPRPFGSFIGITVGALFTVTSICSLAVVSGRRRQPQTRDQRRLRLSMSLLYLVMILVFVPLVLMRQHQVREALDLGVRMTPLWFLLVSMYYESRFEFYDLVIKRGVILILSLLLLGATFAAALSLLDQIPGTIARPWLFAVVLLPVAMILPWLHQQTSQLLDRLWLGRDFTPVEAVKHVLGVMQQATDEASLVSASEATLSEMFRRRVLIRLDDQPPPEGEHGSVDVAAIASPHRIRLAVMNEPGARPLLSEDLAMLRSLTSVFGFMLENVRLQRKRQEQEQVAQALRLQTSRSELKALRAQINPHFLFNALNAIASLIHTDPVRADAAVEQLAEVFRYTLRRSDQEWAPLDQELAFARAYLDVEQARFGRRLEFSIEADPALGRAQVPSMLLQTLVENAVKHGISRVRTPGRIDVRAARAGNRVTLEVRDTGPGLDVSPHHPSADGESFGLRSVRERLDGYFGADAALELVRERETTVARIRLPFVEQTSPVVGAAR